MIYLAVLAVAAFSVGYIFGWVGGYHDKRKHRREYWALTDKEFSELTRR